MPLRLAVVVLLASLTSACCGSTAARQRSGPCGDPSAHGAPAATATPSVGAAPSAGPATEGLVLQIHDVSDLVQGDPSAMERLLERVSVWASYPGGVAAAQGLTHIVVKAPPRVQDLVADRLRAERAPLRIRYFDVRDLVDRHPTLEDDLRPLLQGVEGESMAVKNRTLIVRAPTPVLEAIQSRLEALRAAN